MIRNVIRPAAIALLLSASTFSLKAQSKQKEKETQDIVIRKKSDKGEKLTIIVDGDRVTVNGKPIEEFRNEDVQVLLRKAKGLRINDNKSLRDVYVQGYSTPNKAFLGVSSDIADNGARILAVTDTSAAEKAGLKEGDIITKINETLINEDHTLYNTISKQKPGDKVEITYLRNGKTSVTSATLGKTPRTMTSTWSGSWSDGSGAYSLENLKGGAQNWSMDIPNLMVQGRLSRPRLGIEIQDLEEGKGVKVTDVDDESPIARAGLKEEDIITKINDKEVEDVDAMRLATREFKSGDTFKVEYKRNGATATTNVKIPKKVKTANL
jgi:serine protease Do